MKKNAKKTEKNDEEIADEVIKDFFEKIEGSYSQNVEKHDLDSLNTVKSSGDFDEDRSLNNIIMKDSHYKFDKSSSKLRNNDSDRLATPLKELNSGSLKQVFKFEVVNNENTQTAAKFIQKRFRIYLKNKESKKRKFFFNFFYLIF